MSRLLDYPTYGPRGESLFLQEMNDLTERHLQYCPEYSRIFPDWKPVQRSQDLPFLHVGIFKHFEFKARRLGTHYERTLKSSATTSALSSKIPLDSQSSAFHSRSSNAILEDFLGQGKRPLLILDSARSLRNRRELSARLAAAMCLQPLSIEIQFLLEDPEDPLSMKWDLLQNMLEDYEHFWVYGFTWILWLAWERKNFPDSVRKALIGKSIHFVHSGGWKKLEALKINESRFKSTLLEGLDQDSDVLDFYGLVEQVGVIYPQCEEGFRHIPVWADIFIRDPFTLKSIENEVGQLQLLNTLAHGAPYHSVLTEDLGCVSTGVCNCGRLGKKFKLLGRVPKSEVRGCANV